ncbi:hypothetical protein Dimus_001484 [Dionaea muscipula]
MIVRLSNEKDVATTKVRGVNIELDCMTLCSILKIPRNYGLSDYVKEVWEEARYCKPLEITKKFSNDETITKTGRVLSTLMKPFQRMVPLDDREGDEPIKTDFFKETFLNMSQLKRENSVWWLGSGANRRRDDEVNEIENEENEEEAKDTDEVENKGQNQQVDFDWEVVNEEVHVEGEQVEKEDEIDDFGSGEKFYDVVDDERPVNEDISAPAVEVPASAVPDVAIDKQQGKAKSSGVDPSSSLNDYDLLHLQVEFVRAFQRNTRFQELYQQLKTNPPTSPKP